MKNKNRKLNWKKRQAIKDHREQMYKRIELTRAALDLSRYASFPVSVQDPDAVDFGKHLVVGNVYSIGPTIHRSDKVKLLKKGRVFGLIQEVNGGTPWSVMLSRLREVD